MQSARRQPFGPRGPSVRTNVVCGADDLPHDLDAVYVTPPCLELVASPSATGGGVAAVGAAGGANPNVVCEPFPVTYEGVEYEGWIAYEKGAPPLPQVLVIPNYAGLKQFDKDVAVYLASVGFVGLAVDIYAETIPGYSIADRSPNSQPGWRELPRERKQEIAASHMAGAFEHVNHCVCNPGFFRGSLAGKHTSNPSWVFFSSFLGIV